jgi:hypothetical protein
MIDFVAAVPALGPVVSDLVAKNMDWDTSGAFAERIAQWQTATMPYLHQGDAMDNMPPQAKAIIGQLQGQLQQAGQHLQTLSQAYQAEKYKTDTQAVAHASKERQVYLKGMFDLQIKKLDLISQAHTESNKLRVAEIKAQLDHIHNSQRVHLDALKLFDQGTGTDDQTLYNSLGQMMNNNNPPPSSTPAALPAPQNTV